MEFSVEWIGWIGLSLLLMAWVPQTWETIKMGRCPVHLGFVILYFIASVLLAIYAGLIDDTVFMLLNGLLAFGSGINLYYKFFPRTVTL